MNSSMFMLWLYIIPAILAVGVANMLVMMPYMSLLKYKLWRGAIVAALLGTVAAVLAIWFAEAVDHLSTKHAVMFIFIGLSNALGVWLFYPVRGTWMFFKNREIADSWYR